MSALGHSRRGRLLRIVGPLPQCPESGRKVRASPSVAMGQKLTHAVQQMASLFNHLVGAAEHGWGHGDVQRFRGLQIEHHLESTRRLHRQLGRLDAL